MPERRVVVDGPRDPKPQVVVGPPEQATPRMSLMSDRIPSMFATRLPMSFFFSGAVTAPVRGTTRFAGDPRVHPGEVAVSLDGLHDLRDQFGIRDLGAQSRRRRQRQDHQRRGHQRHAQGAKPRRSSRRDQSEPNIEQSWCQGAGIPSSHGAEPGGGHSLLDCRALSALEEVTGRGQRATGAPRANGAGVGGPASERVGGGRGGEAPRNLISQRSIRDESPPCAHVTWPRRPGPQSCATARPWAGRTRSRGNTAGSTRRQSPPSPGRGRDARR